MFDPNQALPDFERQQAEVVRQRQIAEFLRKRPIDQPQLRMAGNIAVQPHWLERLVPLLNQYQTGQADRNASSAEQSMLKQQQEVAGQWRASMPQAAPAEPFRAGTPDVPGAQEGEAASMAIPTRPVDRNAILKYALAGLNNPRTAKEAAIVNQSLTSDLQREEDKIYKREERAAQETFRAQESELARTQAAELKREQLAQAAELKREQLKFQEQQLTAQLADRALSREQQLAVSKMLDATRREIAAVASGASADRDADRQAAKDAARQAKEDADIQKLVQRLSHNAVNLAPLREAAVGIQELLDNTPRKPDGTTVSIPGLGRENFLSPLVRSEQGNVNRQKVQKFANAVLRAQAGLSQTLSEQERVDLELMASGKFTQKEFERAWPATISKLNTQLGNLRAGVPKRALEEYKTRGGPALDDVTPKPFVALPKATAEQMPEGMDPARWARLQELRKAAGGSK